MEPTGTETASTSTAAPATTGSESGSQPRFTEQITLGSGGRKEYKRDQPGSGFRLSEKAQKALNVNEDFSEAGEVEGANTNSDPNAKADTSGKTTAGPADGKDGDQEKGTPEGEQPSVSKDAEKKDGEPVGEDAAFHAAVGDYVKQFDTPEKRQKLMKDLENGKTFMASNTQEAQRNAEVKKELEATARELSLGEIGNVLKTIEADDQLEQQMELLDEFNGGSDKNPIRMLLGLMTAAKPAAEKRSRELQEIEDREADLAIDNQILSLKRIEGSPFNYGDEAELQKTFVVADKYGLDDLEAAHKIRVSEQLQEASKTHETRIKALEKELTETKEALEKAKAGVVPIARPAAQQNPKFDGNTTFRFKPKEIDMDATRNKVRQKLGLTAR